jgi:hypothetical protein
VLSIYATSTEYVAVPVSNNEGINLTVYNVQFAFLGPYANVAQAQQATPNTATVYHGGIWQTDVLGTPPNQYVAACLVGPTGTVALTEGVYLVLVQIVATPQSPILYSGPLVVS